MQASFLMPLFFMLIRLVITLRVHELRWKGWWRGSALQKKTSKPPVVLPWRDICIYKRNVSYTKISLFFSLSPSLSNVLKGSKYQNQTLLRTNQYTWDPAWMCVLYYRSVGQCVDQILLYLWKKLQDIHHGQHRGQTSQQTGELLAEINHQTLHV